MMAFARRQELQPEVTDLRQLIIGIMPVLVRSVGLSISIETRIPDLLDPLRIDPKQLEVALLNLALNARDAMPEGGRILIGAQEEDVESDGADGHLAGGRYIRLSLGDDGDGMDRRILVQAAETLFSTKYPAQGAGLGLAMVSGFAERSAGRFVLRSKKGKGTVAELWLPVSADPAGVLADSAPDVVDKALYRRTRSASALAVLAVDSDRLSLMQTSSMLNDLGYKVFTATSGEAALAMLRSREAINVVIIDHSMPGLSGPDLAEAIRLEWPTMAVIFATPLADARLQQIAKPVRRDDLAAAMIKALPRPAPTTSLQAVEH
jgi:CheY-like chemotaxis protein